MVSADLQRSVGRPREFDEDLVLEAAMDAFWKKGYEATSLSDLCACTGLHKGSLYQAFGDKHTLFMRALKHYSDREFREVMTVANVSDSPLENIRAAVQQICGDAGNDKGCLVINSMVELAPHDPEVKAAIESFGEMRLKAMTHWIAQAQAAGEIRAGLEPGKLARQMMLTLAGAAALVKGFVKREEVLETVDAVIDSWT